MRPPMPAEDPDPLVRERELALMGRVSGWLIAVAVPVTALAALLPGARVELPAFAILCVLFLVQGLTAATGLMRWGRIPIERHAIAVATSLVVLGVAVWATGGATSFVVPYLACTLLYIAYFFPARFAWPLGAIVVVVVFSPVAYTEDPAAGAFLPRALMSAVAFGALTVALRFLRERLVDAERVQRRMADEDALTGVANRRAYDAALTSATDGSTTTASVVLLDLDGFKAVNDRHGHLAGDALLRDVAGACRAAVGEGWLVARIGGDEFAVVAPGADAAVAAALAARAGAAVRACRRPDGAAVDLAVAHATWPEDGDDASSVVACADARMYDAKRRTAAGDVPAPADPLPPRRP